MSGDRFLETLREEMGSVLADVAPEQHSPSLAAVTAGGRRLVRRRRAVWSAGVAMAALAMVAMVSFGPLGEGRAAPVLPGATASHASPNRAVGTVEVWAPRPDGSVTRFRVALTRHPDGSGSINARSLVSSDSAAATVSHLVGSVAEASNGLDYLAVIPTGAQGPQILDAHKPKGTTQSGPPTDVPGLPLQLVVFSFANLHDAPPHRVVWFRPDGTPSTNTEVGGQAQWTVGGQSRRVWALPGAGWLGGTEKLSTPLQPLSTTSALSELRFNDVEDGSGVVHAVRAYAVKGGVRSGSVVVQSPPGHTGLTTSVAPIGTTGFTAIFVAVQVPYDAVATATGTAVEKVTWIDQAGTRHTWRP